MALLTNRDMLKFCPSMKYFPNEIETFIYFTNISLKVDIRQ